jgi:hypothetical protein
MSDEIFDVKAALKEHPESDVAGHLAKIHGIDRDAYLKEGLTDSAFLAEYGGKTLPVVSTPTSSHNDPLTGAIVGGVAGSAAEITNRGIDISKALDKFSKGMNAAEAPPAAPPQPDLTPGEKYKSKTGFGAGEGESVKEVSDEWKRIEAEKKKPIGRGKVSSRVIGGSPDEILARAKQEELELAEQARLRAQQKLAKESAEIAKQRALAAEQKALAAEAKYAGPNKVGKALPVAGATLGYNAMDVVNQAKEGDVGQTIVAGAGTAGSVAPFVKKLPPKLRALGFGASLLAPIINRTVDVVEEKAEGGLAGYSKGKAVQKVAKKLSSGLDLGKILPSATFKSAPEQTVTDPLRNAFPGIYKRPDVIAEEAAARVAPESPALKQLFGVTRDDLYEMGKGRVGNMPGLLPGAAANPKGSRAALNVMNPRNEQRLLDVLSESEKHPALVRGMDPWYIMDPAYKRLEELVGPEEAVKRYRQLNTLTGMASPGSDVLTEMNRGTAANYLATQGRFNDFVDYAGKPMGARGADFPDDLRAVMGHPYHRTAQAIPMQQYLDTGAVQMSSPKVPAYIQASSVPQAGFQTDLPVGDAHWSRAVGLADTRGAATRKGQSVVPGASVSNPEMSTLAPWWKDKIAGQVGLESVPAQARAWGAFSPQTGVESPIGAPKLELLSMKIMEAANRYGVSPEQARDMILKGEGYAGKAEGGSIQGYGKGGKILELAKDFVLPAAENAARTQIIGTLPTYGKAAEALAKHGAQGRAIDFGAGLGEGAKMLGKDVDTYEPFAKNWSPTFTKPEDIPSDAYGRLTNLNVLNVVPREARDEIVQHIGRVMEPGGLGVLTTRGADVMKAQGRPGPEPMSMITSRDTYQKGFTKQELEDYIRYMLGKGYDIDKLNLGPAGVMIKKK